MRHDLGVGEGIMRAEWGGRKGKESLRILWWTASENQTVWTPCTQLIYSLSKYLLSDYHVQGSVLSTGDSAVNKRNQIFGYHRLTFQGGEGKTKNKQARFFCHTHFPWLIDFLEGFLFLTQ